MKSRDIFLILLLFSFSELLFSQAFPNPVSLSTGQGAIGSLDPIWTCSQWYSTQPSNLSTAVFTPALINNNCAPGNWVNPATLPPPVNNGNWITGQDANCAANTTDGFRFFRLTLNLPSDCGGVSVTQTGVYKLFFDGYVDNQIIDVFLNGNPLGISGGSFGVGTDLSFSINGPWLVGTNYIDVLVYNAANGGAINPYGLLLVADAVSVTGNPIPLISTSPASCSANGSAVVTNYSSSNNYTFTPTGPTIDLSGNLSNLTPGTSYTVKSTDSSCMSVNSTPFTIQAQLIPPPVPTVNTVAATCSSNGTATVSNYSATNTYTFSPLGPSVGSGGSITGMVAGTNYTVTATSSAGCTSAPSNSFTIQAQLATPPAPIINTNTSTCSADGTASVTNYSATNTYTFSPLGPAVGSGGIITNITPSTNYTVSSTNTAGCTSSPSNSFSIQAQLASPPIPVISTNMPTCSSNGTATVTNYMATNTYTFSPSGPSIASDGSIFGLTVGTNYTLVATGSNGCVSAVSTSFLVGAQLTIPSIPSPIMGQDTLLCGTSSNYSVTNVTGVTYAWSYTGVGTISGSGNAVNLNNVTTSGIMTVIPSNSCGDGPSQSLNITITNIQATVSKTDVMCDSAKFGSAYVVPSTGTPPFTYSWSNGQNVDSIVNLSAGTYAILVTDANGCQTSDSVVIVQTGTIGVDITPNPISVNEGTSEQLNTVVTPYIPGSTYLWDPSSTLSCGNCPSPYVSPLQTTTYFVTVTTPQNCQVSDSVLVKFIMNCGDVYIPNIFSPNGDNQNDLFNVYGRCISKLNMKIFNRWGEKIYETSDPKVGWDGRQHGELVLTDTYMYIISVGLMDGSVKDYTGSVTVTR